MDYIHRHIEQKIKEAQSMFKAVLGTGARQVGKSTLLKHISADLPYLTFDDPMLLNQAKMEPGLFFRNHPYPLILDEVQYIQELFHLYHQLLNLHLKILKHHL